MLCAVLCCSSAQIMLHIICIEDMHITAHSMCSSVMNEVLVCNVSVLLNKICEVLCSTSAQDIRLSVQHFCTRYVPFCAEILHKLCVVLRSSSATGYSIAVLQTFAHSIALLDNVSLLKIHLELVLHSLRR